MWQKTDSPMREYPLSRGKYGANKTEIDGYKFSSKMEASFYRFFRENNITIVDLQPRYLLQDSFIHDGKTIRKIEYVADFIIDYQNDIIIVECKGFETPAYKLKEKLFLKRYGAENMFIVAKSLKDLKEQLGIQ